MNSTKLTSILILCLGFLLSLTVRADESSRALTFKAWKEQQILAAQNQLLRASADLETQKKHASPSSQNKVDSPKERALERFRTTSARTKTERLEVDVRKAQESVKAAMDLNLDTYITVYLPSLSESPESLEKLLEQLSKEELSKILAELLKRQSDQRDSLTKAPSPVRQVLTAATRNQP